MAFETERLSVRQMGAADAPFMLAVLNDPGFLSNIGDRGVRTIEAAEAYLRDRVVALYPGGLGMLRVERRGDGDGTAGEGLGIVGFVRRDGLPAPDLGFAFLAAHGGQGYATEAGAGLLAHAPAMRPLLAVCRPDNHGSAAVLRKLGFVGEGEVMLPGHEGPSRLFRLP